MSPETYQKVMFGGMIAIFVSLLGVFAGIAVVGAGNDNANEKRKNIGIIVGISALLIVVFTGLIYSYFSSNPAYTNTYLIMATSCSILLSLIALSISTLSV